MSVSTGPITQPSGLAPFSFKVLLELRGQDVELGGDLQAQSFIADGSGQAQAPKRPCTHSEQAGESGKLFVHLTSPKNG